MKKFSRGTLGFLLAMTLFVQVGSTALAESPKVEKQIHQTLMGADRYTKNDSDASILKDVVKRMTPAITDFLMNWKFKMIGDTTYYLESKYAYKRLKIDWDNVTSDGKMFVVVLLSGKKYCYQVKGEYSATLVKSSRCS